MNMTNLKNQKGIGLIEVLIAVVIFALGSIAIIQLQGNFFKSTGAAHSHAIAMNLAEEKLEDLRALEDFSVISTNSGGNIACTNTLLPSGASAACATSANVITESNTEYELSWEVTDYYYNTGALSTIASGNIAQKDIRILVSWADADGSAQSSTSNTIINSASVGSGGVLVSNAGGSGEQPEVPYTPSIDDRVTPISVGTDSKRETLVPSSETVDGYSRTEFVAYTYNSSNVLTRQEEFQNVACDCRFDGTSGTGTETYAAAHAEWDSVKDTYVDVDGELVVGKVKGCVQGGGSNCDANPEPLCEVCCRDHHDISSVTRKYDPYRSTDDYETSGNHRHYNGTTTVTSGQYQESCRMKRVDGHWRVYQDWNIVNFKALPITDLSVSTVKATYAGYVKDIVDAHLDESKVSGETLTTPPSLPASLNHNTSSNYINLAVNGVSEISGRGLYIDFIDSTHLAAVQAKKAASEDYLLHLPFYELEVVEVADWTSADDSILEVGPIDRNPGTVNDVLAGEIDGIADGGGNAVVLSADMRKSNSGLTDLSVAVDYNATTNADDVELSDSLTVCVGTSCSVAAANCSSPFSPPGADIIDGNSVTAYQTASVITPASCVSETRTCSNGTLSGSYTYVGCSQITAQDCVTPWNTTVTDGTVVTAYQDSAPVNTACVSEDATCTTGTFVPAFSYTNETCTPVVTSCDTTVSGTTYGSGNTPSDVIQITDGTTTYDCTEYKSGGQFVYTCPTITTPQTGTTITVTSTGTGAVNSPQIILPYCGARTADFR